MFSDRKVVHHCSQTQKGVHGYSLAQKGVHGQKKLKTTAVKENQQKDQCGLQLEVISEEAET